MHYEIRFTKEATKDIKKLNEKQRKKLKEILLHQITVDPFCGKKLIGGLNGCYSVRLNIHDRIVYSIDASAKVVTIHKTKTHYGS